MNREQQDSATTPRRDQGGTGTPPVRMRAIVALTTVSLVVAAAAAVVVTQRTAPEHTPAPAPQSAATTSVEFFAEYNFSLMLAPEWREVPTDSVPLPRGFVDPVRTYAYATTSCMLSYAARTPTAATLYTPTTNNLALRRDETLVTQVERRAPEARVASTTPRRAFTSPFVVDEFAFAYYPLYYDTGSTGPTFPSWVLFSTEGAVPAACSDAFVRTLRSLTMYYPEYTLESTDSGAFTIQSTNERTTLSFHEDRGARHVAILADGPIRVPTVYDDALYYITEHALIERYDTAENTITTVHRADKVVHDFYLVGTTLYYLAGDPCFTDGRSCALTLVAHNMHTGSTTALVEEVPAYRLFGMSDELQALYFGYEEEDDTYLRGAWYRYQLNDGVYGERYVYELALDDEEALATHHAQVDELAELVRLRMLAQSISYQAGSLAPGPQNVPGVVTDRLPILFIRPAS